MQDKVTPRDAGAGTKWWQLAAEQGHAVALKALDDLQGLNGIPAPQPGSTITTVLLTPPFSMMYNNRSGVVVAPAEDIRAAQVTVLLDGESTPMTFKIMNLRVRHRVGARNIPDDWVLSQHTIM